MLVSAAFMQSMAAFTAQNKGLAAWTVPSRAFSGHGPFLRLRPYHGLFHLFHGDILAGLFTSSPSVMAAAADYLKAYAFDAFLTSFLFCFIGFTMGWSHLVCHGSRDIGILWGSRSPFLSPEPIPTGVPFPYWSGNTVLNPHPDCSLPWLLVLAQKHHPHLQ